MGFTFPRPDDTRARSLGLRLTVILGLWRADTDSGEFKNRFPGQDRGMKGRQIVDGQSKIRLRRESENVFISFETIGVSHNMDMKWADLFLNIIFAL